MKKTLFFSIVGLATMILLLSSCSGSKKTNEPELKTYYSIEFVNTTSKYCVAIYFDGVSAFGNNYKLWAGDRKTIERQDINEPVDIKVEWYEIKDDTHYYTKIVTTATKKGYKFSPSYRYKLTIRETDCSISPIAL